MTSRERLIAALRNEIPDHVPAAPDMWEMIPMRLMNGRPSWEMLLFNDPPVWKGRADAATHFGVDGFFGLHIPAETNTREVIVHQEEQKMITRFLTETDDGRAWSPTATVYHRNEPSAHLVELSILGIPEEPESWTEVRRNYEKFDREYFEDAREYVGETGLVAPMVCLPCLSSRQDEIYRYYDDPAAVREEKRREGEAMLERARELLSWEPDALMLGNSGMMLFNPEPVFRDLVLEWMKKVTAMAKEKNIPTHIHCCGKELDLVRIGAEETDLDSIEPLEIPPMGDCVLKEVKERYGDRLALKGNLHTTEIMLRATREQVADACKQAIDDAAEGGGFILSTGDQTPRDAPDENIRVMQEVAETYGKYE
ncbi:uroporphyrinogen decarboxylase family protein [Kiritimatiella glycovorans]|uniref:Methylcobalamin methyltransferase n=1 Tax=Kiritimatiella glycovorans TaxID=1307763 RepID=A0A0G3EH70_9BACT|nr:uroporphyrinogen decarboxylase family protein [Kiritimatiella glycovorans]AKJ64160.1 methylcobalamin methyltransferase [Kiritimatiella glycovorans]